MLVTLLERVKKSDLDPIAHIGAVLGVFFLLNRYLLAPWVLTEDNYRKPIILVQTIRSLSPASWRTVAVVVIAAILMYHWRKLSLKWTDLESGQPARLIVCVAVGLLAWTFSTYSYNYFLGTSHAVDRVLVVGFALGIVFRPLFVFPFLLVVWPLAGQFGMPFRNSGAPVSMPMHVVLLMGAVLLLVVVADRDVMPAFFFLVVCIVAANYFESGIGKLEIGWFSSDEPHYLLPNIYSSGWLGPLSEGQISAMTRTARSLNPFLTIGVAVLELGAIFALLRGGVTRAFLVGWVVLHGGILLLSGIAFWQWTGVLVSLIIVERRTGLLTKTQVDLPHVLMSVAVIGSTIFWLGAPRLAWIDSPATYTYQYVAIGESGQEYTLPVRSFAPTHYGLSLSLLHFLSDEPTLQVGFGATGVGTYEILRESQTADDLLALEAQYGTVRFNEVHAQNFEQLMVAFMQHQNESLGDRRFPRWLRAPSNVWVFDRGFIYNGQESLRAIRTERFLSAFINGRYVAFEPFVVSEVVVEEP